MIHYLEVECMLYDVHSLKEKRSILKRLFHRLAEANVSVSELSHHDLWQRTTFGLVTLSNSRIQCERVMAQALEKIDQHPDIECLNIVREWY